MVARQVSCTCGMHWAAKPNDFCPGCGLVWQPSPGRRLEGGPRWPERVQPTNPNVIADASSLEIHLLLLGFVGGVSFTLFMVALIMNGVIHG